MKILFAAGMVVIGLLAIGSIFAMIHQQDNTHLEAAPWVSEIANVKCLPLPPFFYSRYYYCS